MTTEPSSENITPQTKSSRVSFATLTATVIAIGALCLGLNNFRIALQDKIIFVKEIAKTQRNTHFQLQNAIATARYSAQLANTDLTINHNPTAALQTLLTIENTLARFSNENLIPAKQALSNDIAVLRAVPAVPTNDIYTQIAAFSTQIQTVTGVPQKPAVSIANTAHQIKNATEEHRHEKWDDRILKSLAQLKTLFVIQHIAQPNAILISPEMQASIKQNILMHLSIAQWGLLHHDQTVFQSALESAATQLTLYFPLSDAKNDVVEKLNALAKLNINPKLPTIQNTIDALTAINDADVAPQTATAIPDTQSIAPLTTKPKKHSPVSPKSNTTDIET